MARILLADDEAAVRRAFKTLFESEGHSVRAARDGEEALALFDEEKPDIVLLDVMMPKKNGIAACREIRERDKLVPVLFFTAAPDDAALVRAFGAGADDYIDKTKSPGEFLARVASALRRTAAAESSRGAASVVSIGRTKVGRDARRRRGDASHEIRGADALASRLAPREDMFAIRHIVCPRGRRVRNLGEHARETLEPPQVAARRGRESDSQRARPRLHACLTHSAVYRHMPRVR